jgi:hypothetical protein
MNGDTAWGITTPSAKSLAILGKRPASYISKKAFDETASRCMMKYGL